MSGNRSNLGRAGRAGRARVRMAGLVVGVVALLWPAAPASAAAGDLDPTWGGTGKVITDLGTDAYGQAIAVQSNSKVVVAGGINGASDEDTLLMRYKDDGNLDSNFGGGDGWVSADLGGDDQARAVAIQTEGYIVTAGAGEVNGVEGFAVARFDSSGKPDNSFSTDGKVLTKFTGVFSSALSMAIQSNGKIVVAGEVYDGSQFDLAMARYTTDGQLDTGFSGDGKLTFDNSGSEEGLGVAIDTANNGIVVAAGSTGGAGGCDFLVLRYTTSGTPDDTFDGNGVATVDFTGNCDVAYSVVPRSSGKLLVGGSTVGTTRRKLAVAKLKSDGSLDTSFGGGDGKASVKFTADVFADALAVQSDGKIVQGGEIHSSPSVDYDFAVARYTSDGVLDRAFSSDGRRKTDVCGDYDFVYGLAIDPATDRTLQVGYGYPGTGARAEVCSLRYKAA